MILQKMGRIRLRETILAISLLTGPAQTLSSGAQAQAPSVSAAPGVAAVKVPPSLYGKWHEDITAGTEQSRVFVPATVELGFVRFRQTLEFHPEGSFTANVLAPIDAQYKCEGSFAMSTPRRIDAKCLAEGKDTRFAYRLVEVKAGRLVLAPAPELPAPQNPYLRRLQARRKVWEMKKPKQYAMVYDIAAMMKSPAATQIRVEVVDGRVVSARGVLYGGDAMAAQPKTMDDLFAFAERQAAFGENGIPAKFKVSYARYGSIASLEADGRTTIADDESGFRVACFDADVKGCAPRLLTDAQCTGAGGWLVAQGAGCDRGGWSIGLVGNAQACCRTYSAGDRDELTVAQCKAVDGSGQLRGPTTLTVGSSQMRGMTCQRRFVGGGRGP